LPNYYNKFFELCQVLSFKISKRILKIPKSITFTEKLRRNKPLKAYQAASYRQFLKKMQAY